MPLDNAQQITEQIDLVAGKLQALRNTVNAPSPTLSMAQGAQQILADCSSPLEKIGVWLEAAADTLES